MLLHRLLTVSVSCDDCLGPGGELAEWRMLHLQEQYWRAAIHPVEVGRCLWSSGILLLGNCTKEDQVHPIRGFGFFIKITLNSLHKYNVFLFAWKNQYKHGENLWAFLRSFYYNTLGSIPFLLLKSVFAGPLVPRQ